MGRPSNAEIEERSRLAVEQREEIEAKADKAVEDKSSEQTSRDERIAELKRELEMVRERLALKDVEYQRKHAAWVNGDFKSFKSEHPFQILIQTGTDAVTNMPVKVWVNGDLTTMERGKWVHVPHKVVHALKNAEVNTVQQMVTEDGNVTNVPILRNRHPYSAFPLDCFAQDSEGKCACTPEARRAAA